MTDGLPDDLFALAAALTIFIVVKFALDPVAGAVEEVDLMPEQVFKIGFKPGVAERCDERIEYVGNGTA